MESFPGFLFVEERFICYEDPPLVLLQDVLLKSCGRLFQDDGGWTLLGGWSLLGRLARWFLEENSTSHMRLHFHVLEEGVVKSTVKLQFGPVADDMLEGGNVPKKHKKQQQ